MSTGGFGQAAWSPCMSIRRTSTTHRLIENGCKDLAGADGRVGVVGELEEEEDGAREELHHGDDDPGVYLGRDSRGAVFC